VTGNWEPVSGYTKDNLKDYGGAACFLAKPATNGEAPAWCLFLNGRGGVCQPFISDNLSSGNFLPGPGFTFPFPFQQGSVLALTEAEYDRVKASDSKP